MPKSQGVFKAFYEPRTKLLVTLMMFLTFIYFFSIIAFYFLSDPAHGILDPYAGLCGNLYTCFSMIFDTTLKRKIAGFF